MADYLLSAAYVEEKYRSIVDENPDLAPVFTVRREYLEAAFDEINKHYGGVDAYLELQLGVDVNLLRQIYTVNSL